MSIQPIEHVDGNVIQTGIKIKNEMSLFTEKLLGPKGYFTKLFTIIDVHILVLMIGIQSSILNYYILNYNSWSYWYYILFGFDMITILTMIWSIITAKKYFELQDRIENPTYYSDGIDCNPANNFGHQVLFCKLPKKLGILPFIYICWLIYTLSLIAKILIIFISNVPNRMLQDIKIGPQVIEMTIALTSIIFLVFMYAHRNSENEYHRQITKSWTEDMISHTVFEIFDSIMFFDLVMPERDHHHNHEVKHELRESIGPILEYTIIGLASFNFLIPTISLYHLSQLSACKGIACKKIDLKGKLRHILIHFMRLFSVNIAYLVIRVYVSSQYDKAITIFIIKNILCIIMSFRSLFIEINEYYSTKRLLKEGGSTNGINKTKSNTAYGHSHGYELQNISNNVNDKLMENNSKKALVDSDVNGTFEDVSLK